MKKQKKDIDIVIFRMFFMQGNAYECIFVVSGFYTFLNTRQVEELQTTELEKNRGGMNYLSLNSIVKF